MAQTLLVPFTLPTHNAGIGLTDFAWVDPIHRAYEKLAGGAFNITTFARAWIKHLLSLPTDPNGISEEVVYLAIALSDLVNFEEELHKRKAGPWYCFMCGQKLHVGASDGNKPSADA